MKIVPIFENNLFAFKYPGEEKDEFLRLFELWQDAEYLEDFFENHKADLKNGFFGNISIDDAIFETFDYAQDFEQRMLELSSQKEEIMLGGLENIFCPLHNSETKIYPLGKSKAKNTWLRVYALRIDKNAYIVTGGAIKLTQKMQDREHTNDELRKIERCRRFLIEQGIVDIDGLIEELEI